MRSAASCSASANTRSASSVGVLSSPGTLRCPACGAAVEDTGPPWRLVSSRGETDWHRCASCRSYFMAGEYRLETEVSHTQQMAWGEQERGEQLNEFKQRMYHSIVQKLGAQGDPRGRTLLDVGCAYGGFMQVAAAAGFRVWGYDIVPEAVARVQAAGMAAQCCAQMSQFSLCAEPFDVISVLDANIYWPDQPEELHQIHAHLKPGGLLVMRVVDKSWLATIGAALRQVAPERGAGIVRRAVNDHRFSMPVGSLLRVLERTGFRVISATPRGALHSDQSSLPVKLSFAIGIAAWQAAGVFLAPGAVIMAERPPE